MFDLAARFGRALTFAAALLLVVPAALADGPQVPAVPDVPPAAATAATFSVTVIHASRSAGGVDKSLQDLERYLVKSFAKYASFKRLDQRDVPSTAARPGSLKLPDGKVLELALRGVDKGFIKVHLSLDGLETTINVRDGGLFFQAGRVYQDGILVLAIRGRSHPG